MDLSALGLYKFLFYKCAFDYTDVGRSPQFMFLQNLRRREFTRQAVDQSSEEIHLIGRQILSLLFKQRRVLIDQILMRGHVILLRRLLVCVNPQQPRELLHIRRMIIDSDANPLGQLFRNAKLLEIPK